MKRDMNKLMELYQGKHGNPFAKGTTPTEIYGNDGEYFAMDDGDSGQNRDASIIDYNTPPGQPGYEPGGDFNLKWNEQQKLIKGGLCQPGLWCQWEINEEGTELRWDGGEKFYYYVEWLKYLINHFFEPWGIKLNGEIEWNGENSNDMGKIVVTDNKVKILRGTVEYKEYED